jgi:hypothetical protein
MRYRQLNNGDTLWRAVIGSKLHGAQGGGIDVTRLEILPSSETPPADPDIHAKLCYCGSRASKHAVA